MNDWVKEKQKKLDEILAEQRTLGQELVDCFKVRVDGKWDEQMARRDQLIERRDQLERKFKEIKSTKMPQFSDIDEDLLRDEVRNEIKFIDRDRMMRESIMERVKVAVDWNLTQEQI